MRSTKQLLHRYSTERCSTVSSPNTHRDSGIAPFPIRGKDEGPSRAPHRRYATPCGSSPVGTSALIVRSPTANTKSLLSSRLVTYSVLPSGLMAIISGRFPAGAVLVIVRDATSTLAT